jgi:phage shock protein C
MKELYRSTTSRVLGGVCGGVGEYMDIDPNIVRLVLVVILLFGFLTIFWPLFIIVLYIVAWGLLPEKPSASP